ncbi:putative short-chain dehydrogenase [Lophiostoma macrostomum CBS 122681]|uniref:Putative short-chain dehydrogenase n=1 Tax=Lophiostoma macrostomum CBS 122681 TaxID=1314788 RepID=A0A6A6SQT4_9PLEO|nr:putative short-chain dehydrogenase [Lophiostoma macrostomum CBS 122681]
MSASKVLLILGSGPNVGKSVAQAFIAKGYKVAHTSRKSRENSNTADEINIAADLSKPESVAEVFTQVKEKLGIPSVVVYNAAAYNANEPKNPVSLPVSTFAQDLTINVTSVYAAAQQAVAGFEQLPNPASRTFIYTGNIMNDKVVIGPLLTLGVGKSATAHIIQNAAAAYAEKGYKFYYGDERQPDGTPMYNEISGEAHATAYVELAEGAEQGPWQYTFVKNQGYKDFSQT